MQICFVHTLTPHPFFSLSMICGNDSLHGTPLQCFQAVGLSENVACYMYLHMCVCVNIDVCSVFAFCSASCCLGGCCSPRPSLPYLNLLTAHKPSRPLVLSTSCQPAPPPSCLQPFSPLLSSPLVLC